MENLKNNQEQEQTIPKRKAFDKVAPTPTPQEAAVIARANMGENAHAVAAHFMMKVEEVKEILAKY